VADDLDKALIRLMDLLKQHDWFERSICHERIIWNIESK
jgi:hypothetical protein